MLWYRTSKQQKPLRTAPSQEQAPYVHIELAVSTGMMPLAGGVLRDKTGERNYILWFDASVLAAATRKVSRILTDEKGSGPEKWVESWG